MAAASNFRAARASVGVGKIPASKLSPPEAVNPDTNADLTASPEVRVSRPTTTLLCILPTANPVLRAISSNSRLAILLIPDVPNNDILPDFNLNDIKCQLK